MSHLKAGKRMLKVAVAAGEEGNGWPDGDGGVTVVETVWKDNAGLLAPHRRPCQGRVASDGKKAWHLCPAATGREHLARQGNNEFGEHIDLAFHRDPAAMLLRDDVVGDRQTEASALAGWLGGEERWNSLSLISSGMPVPLSRTRISTPRRHRGW